MPAVAPNNPKDIKLVILGSSGVGKSALAVRFVQGLFIEHYDPTIEDSYRKSVQIPIGKDEEDHPILKKRTLEILDTAGTDQFAAMRELYLKNGDAFMLVYSITSASSFHELTAFHEQILRIKNASEVPMILVGNKSDLQNDRIISKSQGEELASKWGIKFIETSALRDTNVEQAFMTAPIKVCQDQELEAERRANNKSAKKSIKSCTIA